MKDKENELTITRLLKQMYHEGPVYEAYYMKAVETF